MAPGSPPALPQGGRLGLPHRSVLRRALPAEVEVLESIYLEELRVVRGRARYVPGPAAPGPLSPAAPYLCPPAGPSPGR